eukprot:7049002-Prymnesium_polylepis.1
MNHDQIPETVPDTRPDYHTTESRTPTNKPVHNTNTVMVQVSNTQLTRRQSVLWNQVGAEPSVFTQVGANQHPLLVTLHTPVFGYFDCSFTPPQRQTHTLACRRAPSSYWDAQSG